VESVPESTDPGRDLFKMKEVGVTLENINTKSKKIRPDDPVASRRLTLEKKEDSSETYKIFLGEKTENKSRGTLKCKLCNSSARFECRAYLYQHYAGVHYREQLMKYVDEEKMKCLLCEKTFDCVRNVDRHVGAAHSKVDEYLPEEYRVSKTMTGKAIELKKKREPITNLKYQCYLCLKLHRNRFCLYSHYSQVHFKNEIMTHVDTERLKCKICNMTLPDIHRIIRHVGSAHFIIDQYLPEQHQVAKTINGKAIEMKKKKEQITNLEYKCYLCLKLHKNRADLYSHYSAVHFKNEMMTHVDTENLNCKICNMTLPDIYRIIRHVGSAHSIIDQYLLEQHQVSKVINVLWR